MKNLLNFLLLATLLIPNIIKTAQPAASEKSEKREKKDKWLKVHDDSDWVLLNEGDYPPIQSYVQQAAQTVGEKMRELYTSVKNNTPYTALVGFEGLISRGPRRFKLIEPGLYENILHTGNTLVVQLVKREYKETKQPIKLPGYTTIDIGLQNNRITIEPQQ